MRLAHFSDIHVTLNPLANARSAGAREVLGKRLISAANYYFGRRGRHFHGVEARIAALLADVDAQRVDHALCTGDLTAVGDPQEFSRCAALFGPRLERPERYTVIPGNHDRYTRRAAVERRFERSFGRLSAPAGAFPFVKQLAPQVALVAIDAARPTSLFDSSGRCGPAQLEDLRAVLGDPALAGQFVILALHYGLLKASGRRDRRRHGLRDDRQLLALVDEPGLHLDLIVHGHLHRSFTLRTERRTIWCAGSATDLHVRCGYNVYEIDPVGRSVRCERRVWDPALEAYRSVQ